MTTFTTQTYNMLLQSLLFSITPALPRGSPGTRMPVGDPETIPDATFITRTLVAADGFDAAERTRLNRYINEAIAYYNLFGLAPIIIGSIEDILNHFNGTPGPIGRIRIVSHGSVSFMFVPLFNNGSWEFGIQADRLEAFQSSDEEGLRFLITGSKTQSPTLTDSVTEIVTGIRALNSAVLIPFGLDVSGSPAAGNMKQFFDVVNDHYQVQQGVILAQTNHPAPAPPTLALINTGQQTILTASLDLIESAIRTRLIGTVVGTTTLRDFHLNALKAAVMNATPTQLGFFGTAQNLGATVLADLAAAMGTAPRVEADLRNAISTALVEPMFPNNTANIFNGLNLFNQAALNLGGAPATIASISANADLLSFFLICNDLFFLQHGQVSIAGTPITVAQKTSLRNGLRAIADIIAARVVTGAGGITAAELTRLRTGVEALTTRQTLTSAWMTLDVRTFPELQTANTALTVTASNVGFRTKLNHLRSIMRAASKVDVRGCLVGSTPAFLHTLRDFLGTGANRPTVSAPDWFQSSPSGVDFRWDGSIYPRIDAFVAGGSGAHITAADVTTSFTTWRGLIDFDPHYTFISNLFAAGATTLFDFATLEWRVWRTGGAPTGIPILRIEAERIDDIVGMNLGDLIERFGIIFEIPAGSRPSATVRGRFTSLQPHIVTFKTIRTAVAAAVAPTPAELTGFFYQLSILSGNITGIAGFPAPASPLVPAVAPVPLTLADIQTYAANFQNHIDNLLNTNLGAFFTAVRTQIGHANAQIRYCLNIGVPILLQSTAQPTNFRVAVYMSATSNAQGSTLIANAIRSWMRIQWTGSTAQAAAMNGVINTVAMGTNALRIAATQASMLSEDDPLALPGADAVINPMPGFQGHIITRP